MTTIQHVTLPGGAPRAPLTPAVVAGDLVFASGQIGNDPVTRVLVDGGFDAQLEQCFRNLEAVLEAAGTSLARAVRVGAYLADAGDFPRFNELYAARFAGGPLPARTTIQCGFTVPGMLVELDCVAAR